MQVPLSNEDLEQHLGSQQIQKYSNLSQYKDLYHLMPKKTDYCIVLLEAKENRGHWCVLLRQNKTFYYFNSYGKKYDNKSYLSKMILKILKQDKNEIQRLITATGLKKISYNKTRLQGDNSQVCGRYCVFMVIMNNLGFIPKESINFLKKYKGSGSYDIAICQLV